MNENETCVICHKETNTKKSTLIELRFYYVEGIGQLCAECHAKIYGD